MVAGLLFSLSTTSLASDLTHGRLLIVVNGTFQQEADASSNLVYFVPEPFVASLESILTAAAVTAISVNTEPEDDNAMECYQLSNNEPFSPAQPKHLLCLSHELQINKSVPNIVVTSQAEETQQGSQLSFFYDNHQRKNERNTNDTEARQPPSYASTAASAMPLFGGSPPFDPPPPRFMPAVMAKSLFDMPHWQFEYLLSLAEMYRLLNHWLSGGYQSTPTSTTLKYSQPVRTSYSSTTLSTILKSVQQKGVIHTSLFKSLSSDTSGLLTQLTRKDLPSYQPKPEPEAITLYPVFMIPRSSASNFLEEVKDIVPGQQSCSLCKTGFESADDVVKTNCSHFFHMDCIKQWLQSVATGSGTNHCPDCGFSLGELAYFLNEKEIPSNPDRAIRVQEKIEEKKNSFDEVFSFGEPPTLPVIAAPEDRLKVETGLSLRKYRKRGFPLASSSLPWKLRRVGSPGQHLLTAPSGSERSVQVPAETTPVQFSEYGPDRFKEQVVGNFLIRLWVNQVVPGQHSGMVSQGIIFANDYIIFHLIAKHLSFHDVLSLIRAMKCPELEQNNGNRLYIELLVERYYTACPIMQEQIRQWLVLSSALQIPSNLSQWLARNYNEREQQWVTKDPLRSRALYHYLAQWINTSSFPKGPFMKAGSHRNIMHVIELQDGRLVSGAQSVDRDFLVVWDLRLSQHFYLKHEINSPVRSMAEASGGHLLTTTVDQHLIIWNPDKPSSDERYINSFQLSDLGQASSVLAILPDRGLLALTRDSNIYITIPESPCWTPETCLSGHQGWITCIKVLRSGNLVSGSCDCTLKIWDLDRPSGERCIATLEGHRRRVTCVTELKDGHLVSGSEDNSMMVWRQNASPEDQFVTRIPGLAAPVTCVTVLLSGFLVSGDKNGFLKIWDLRNPEDPKCLDVWNAGSQVNCVTVLRNGDLVVGTEFLRIWKAEEMISCEKYFNPDDF